MYVRTRTYAHSTRQLFDHRPPITHNNLPYSILQRWSKDIQMSDRPPIDHLSISIPAYTFSPFNTILFLLDNNRSIAIYDRPYCSLYLYKVTQHFAKHWKTPLPNVGKHPCQTLENTFAKRWKILLPNVGKYFCQRRKTLLSNVG